MKVLIISHSEICYHPRLLKAADYLFAQGVDVTVFNTITGLASISVYNEIKNSRNWEIVENDISKRTFKSRIIWFLSSSFYFINKLVFKTIKVWPYIRHGSTKNFIFFSVTLKKRSFDYILINLVDTLPFAMYLKSKTGAKIIYDCQEYFKGQYTHFSKYQFNWVNRAEEKYAPSASIVLGTTHVMLKRLRNDFGNGPRYFRVRNLPAKTAIEFSKANNESLKLVWHGLNVIPENNRGVHILLKAISQCKTAVHLYLQGHISEANKDLLTVWIEKLNISGKVTLVNSANPDYIVQSLVSYDIGLAGELAAEDNQKLTSSNKLFEYIYAGLAVIVPDLPGLAETVNEYAVGKLYEQGNFNQLGSIIDKLNINRELLEELKMASRKASEEALFWENDFGVFFNHLEA